MSTPVTLDVSGDDAVMTLSEPLLPPHNNKATATIATSMEHQQHDLYNQQADVEQGRRFSCSFL